MDSSGSNTLGIDMMRKVWTSMLAALLTATAGAAEKEIWLDEIDLETMTCSGGTPRRNESFGGRPLRIFRKKIGRGVGTCAPSIIILKLDRAKRFHARVGLDAEILNKGDGSVRFRVFSENGILADSGVLTKRKGPVDIDVDIHKEKYLALEATDGGDGNAFDHADWGEARFTVEENGSVAPTLEFKTKQLGILTPPPSPEPAIVGPKIFGARPGRPVIFRLCVTAPDAEIAVSGIPSALTYDRAARTLRGTAPDAGDYLMTITASNRYGTAQSKLILRCGEKLALTPPMGWNDWNRFAREVSAAKIMAAADALIRHGIADHGYAYVNIDDYWQRTPDMELAADLQGEPRSKDGTILPNARFPDMEKLTGHIHSLGLKAGLYSTPGPLTCGGCYGSWQHEEQDARTYAQWGFDYLKYDWCSYTKVAPPEANQLKLAMTPFVKMGKFLRAQPRDIVYNLCQYGMDHVSAWGALAEAASWRTTHDVFDNYASIRATADLQDGLGCFTAPGAWNDADMLTVGVLGWGNAAPSRLTRNEQYTQFTLWSIFASPLMLGCELENIDEFTLALITNDEVIAVNQDALGAGAFRKILKENFEVWTKRLDNGDVAMAIVSRDYLPTRANFKFSDAGLDGTWHVRDLWRRKSYAASASEFNDELLGHACFMFRLSRNKEQP